MNFAEDFPLFAEHPDLVYLDNANTTHKPTCVIDAMESFYRSGYGSQGRGVSPFSDGIEQFYERALSDVAGWIGVDRYEIIPTSGATHAANLFFLTLELGRHITADKNIIISRSEHHAVSVPVFQMASRIGCEVRICELGQDYRADLDHLANIVDDHTALVCIQHASNVTGAIHDLSGVRSVI